MAVRRETPAFDKAVKAIHSAVDGFLADPSPQTRDLGGATDCDAFGRRVAGVVAG